MKTASMRIYTTVIYIQLCYSCSYHVGRVRLHCLYEL